MKLANLDRVRCKTPCCSGFPPRRQELPASIPPGGVFLRQAAPVDARQPVGASGLT